MTAPCKDCQDRKVGCHADCDRYEEYAKYRIEISRRRRQEAIAHNSVMQIHSNAVEISMRGGNRVKRKKRDDG